MLDETQPTIPAGLLTPTSVPPRLTGKQARSFRRPNLPPDYMATVGPGLSARPPFVGTAIGPRFTQRDFLVRARRYRQPDPRAALSGLTARTIGSFNGAKLGFLNVQATRSSTRFSDYAPSNWKSDGGMRGEKSKIQNRQSKILDFGFAILDFSPLA